MEFILLHASFLFHHHSFPGFPMALLSPHFPVFSMFHHSSCFPSCCCLPSTISAVSVSLPNRSDFLFESPSFLSSHNVHVAIVLLGSNFKSPTDRLDLGFWLTDQNKNSMSILVFHPHSLKEKHDSIAVDGFCFRFNRAHVKNYAQEFRCCDDKCPARVLFNSCDDFVVLHEHVVCQFDHQKELRSRKRLDKAFDLLQKNPTDAPHKIVEKVQLLIDDELTANEKRSLRAFVTRKRRELLGSPSNDPKELIIPDHLRVTATPVSPDHPDNSFLLFDSNEHQKDAPSRILIFASADMRFKASMATELFADGTYRIVPNGFATLYTIHSVINGVPYPVFFCLMQNEQEKTFLRVLNVVKAHLSRFDANCVVHTDCQRSAINAFKLTFGCKVKLCLFHINQALWR